MKAKELIEQLTKLIDKHQDCEVYFQYDDGVRLKVDSIDYYQNIRHNAFSEYWGMLQNVFIINCNK